MSSGFEDVDSLLEQYLNMIDKYTALRTELSVSQSSIYQNIARANFTAQSGVRYGETSYDEREMQASRLCRITDPAQAQGSPDHSTTASTTATLSTFSPHEVRRQTSDGAQQKEEVGASGKQETKFQESVAELDEKIDGGSEPTANPTITEKKQSWNKPRRDKKDNLKPPDPLRMFGVLNPPAIKKAQETSVQEVAELIPALINLDLQMKAMEIRVRRARKQRKKAEKQSVDASGNTTQAPECETDFSLQQFLTDYISDSLNRAFFHSHCNSVEARFIILINKCEANITKLEEWFKPENKKSLGQINLLETMFAAINISLDDIAQQRLLLPLDRRNRENMFGANIQKIMECETKLYAFKLKTMAAIEARRPHPISRSTGQVMSGLWHCIKL